MDVSTRGTGKSEMPPTPSERFEIDEMLLSVFLDRLRLAMKGQLASRGFADAYFQVMGGDWWSARAHGRIDDEEAGMLLSFSVTQITYRTISVTLFASGATGVEVDGEIAWTLSPNLDAFRAACEWVRTLEAESSLNEKTRYRLRIVRGEAFALEAGMTREKYARSKGIDPSTIREWKKALEKMGLDIGKKNNRGKSTKTASL